MKKVISGDRLRYEFDNFLSRGTVAFVVALFTITACLILSSAAILVATSVRPGASPGWLNFPEAVWLTATRMLDPGVVADDSGWSYRLIGILVTLGGILLSSSLIGILVNGLDRSFDKLRRGRTRVVENGHTLILGWSPHTFTILNELACARDQQRRMGQVGLSGDVNLRRDCVVILADMDRLEMEEEIRLRVPARQKMRIVCRSGDPLDPDVLKIVSPETARAIIILSPGGEYPDLPVGRALVALSLNRDRLHRQDTYIVAAIQRPENLPVMRMFGGEQAQIFLADRVLGYVMAQACLQPGLAPVIYQLLRFEGANIHLVDLPGLSGETYGNALQRLETAALIGFQSNSGTTHLNPPMETVIQPGDRLIVICRNGESIRVTDLEQEKPNEQMALAIPPASDSSQRLLILGWNKRAPLVLEHLGLDADPYMQVKVFAPVSIEQMQSDCSETGYGCLQVMFEEGNPANRLSLEKLVAEGYPYILILNPAGQLVEREGMQIADVFNVVAYLHLRDIAQKTGRRFSILIELMSGRKSELALVNDTAGTAISNDLVALTLSRIAENKEIAPILIDLLRPGSSPIVLNPVENYVATGETVNYQRVVAAARCRGETAIGYRLLSEAGQAESFSGVHLSPEKYASITFKEQDRVIVLRTKSILSNDSVGTIYPVKKTEGE